MEKKNERFAKRKNIHLMWMSRDGGMIALFEKQVRGRTGSEWCTIAMKTSTHGCEHEWAGRKRLCADLLRVRACDLYENDQLS